jgi:hypothetical protein
MIECSDHVETDEIRNFEMVVEVFVFQTKCQLISGAGFD